MGRLYITRIETGLTTPAYMGATWTMPLVYITAHSVVGTTKYSKLPHY